MRATWNTRLAGAAALMIAVFAGFSLSGVAQERALAIAPSAHDIVWAGTGETFIIRPDVGQGNGIYRATDGGRTWDQVLKVDENTGCSDQAIDPNNPRILFAGMWPLIIDAEHPTRRPRWRLYSLALLAAVAVAVLSVRGVRAQAGGAAPNQLAALEGKSESSLRQLQQTDVASFNDLLKTHHLAMTIQP